MLGIRTKAGLIAAALCGFSHVAWADGVTINFPIEFETKDYVWETAPPGTGDLAVMHFDLSMLHAFAASQIQLTGSGRGGILGDQNPDGSYVTADVTLPIAASTGNSDEPVIQSSTVGSGFTMSGPTGNALTLSDFVINTQTHQINAQVFGTNGVGSITDLMLWHAQTTQTTLDKITTQAGGIEVRDYTVMMRGLSWSEASQGVLAQALGLDSLAQNAWFQIQNVGTMFLHVQVVGPAENFTPAVPEPSTYALMGLGLASIGFAARRRRAY